MDQAQHLERALERQDLGPALLFRRHPMAALEVLLMNFGGDVLAWMAVRNRLRTMVNSQAFRLVPGVN